MKKNKIFRLVFFGLTVTILNFSIGIIFIKLFWNLLLNTLFPNLIDLKYINQDITYVEILWLVIYFWIIKRSLGNKLLKKYSKKEK